MEVSERKESLEQIMSPDELIDFLLTENETLYAQLAFLKYENPQPILH